MHMREIQQMQQAITRAQEKLRDMTFVGISDPLTITINGQLEVKEVVFSMPPQALEKDDLARTIYLAIQDALQQYREVQARLITVATGGTKISI